MSPEIPENILGENADDSTGRQSSRDSSSDEELERFVFARIGEQQFALNVNDVRTIMEPPADATRVPRSTDAIEGLVDLRGEITAVINPRIHFPVDEPHGDDQRLIVLDRPSDRQPAALRVDEVLGVETTPVSNVIEDSDEEGERVALDHPLISAVVRKEEQSEADVQNIVSGSAPDEGSSGASDALASRSVEEVRKQSTAVDTFDAGELDDDDDSAEPEEHHEDDGPTIELTPLLDADRLLLASGQFEAA